MTILVSSKLKEALEMVKIKGYRFECEVCKVKASIQVFYRKDGHVDMLGQDILEQIRSSTIINKA